jgi:protein-tyrosine phosphatase
MAEVVLRCRLDKAGLADVVIVDSAGISGGHAGDGMDPAALAALAARGYDGTGHVARQFDPAFLDDRDLLVALDRSHLRVLRQETPAEDRPRLVLLRSFDPNAHGSLDVPDPYGGGHAEFERCLDMIEAACDGLVAHLVALSSEDDGGSSR